MADPIKILVVDDEPDVAPLIRQQFRRQVRQGEYDFSFAQDGLEALEKLEQDPTIDIVLTDINMPRMDGLTLLSNLGRLERYLKSIVVTAYGDMENIRTAMNRGAFDFLTKPIDGDDLSITLNKARQTVVHEKRAQHVREMFGRYLTDEVVSTLLNNPEAVELGGQKRTITMMMADLRGFSTVAESQPPERVVDILNVYLGKMAEVIARFQGTIDEFIGDAIFTLFGAPIQRDDDAPRAVACAIAMQQAMLDVNAEIRNLGLPALEMGIGINTGEVVVGNIGSDHRMKYGVVGSHVNLTSRIESYTVGGQILVSEQTRAACPNLVIGREMEVSTKGFSEPIKICEVARIGEPFNLSLPRAIEHFHPVDETFPVSYLVLDGKYMTGAPVEAELIEIATTGAILRGPTLPAPLANVKLNLFDPAGVFVGELYAKVLEDDDLTDDKIHLRFTAVPADVGVFIATSCGC